MGSAVVMEDESMNEWALHALSPLDGRYAQETAPLREYWSEFAYLQGRVRVEVEYLIALSRETHLVRPLSPQEEQFLRSLGTLTTEGARRIKALEQTTRHDVKAIEYWLREQLAPTSLRDIQAWIHFGLTSEDVNQAAQALALRESRDRVVLPALDHLKTLLAVRARQYAKTPMLARTHGQPAVPTTFGKELAVFLERLNREEALIREHRFEAKLTGAVGNFNAHVAAAPQEDWVAFSEQFLRGLGLEPNLTTTQLMPFDNWLRYFDALRLTGSILLDLAQDLWRYISDDYLVQALVTGEVGSSTMPQKINPIDVENAEGNLGLANALFTHFAQKLPISRLQRDLSDSTVRRSFGVALGHLIVALHYLARGLARVSANERKMRADLEAHWELVAEGAQQILRTAGLDSAYEELKTLVRGKPLDRAGFQAWVRGLRVDDTVKTRLEALTPLSYLGLSEELTRRVVGNE
jgi:adenylosuccinate lyase